MNAVRFCLQDPSSLVNTRPPTAKSRYTTYCYKYQCYRALFVDMNNAIYHFKAPMIAKANDTSCLFGHD